MVDGQPVGQTGQGGQGGQQVDTSNMTPEQIAQLQQQNCIFCHIVSGKVQSKKVFEDEDTIGILDINPANPGHVLILPKKHHAIMPQMDDMEIGHIFTVSKHVSGALLKALKAEGTNIFVANGAIAGQKAPHFMVHVIPRKEGDDLNMTIPENNIQMSELLKVRDMLMPRIKENLKLSDSDIDALKDETEGSAGPEVSYGQEGSDGDAPAGQQTGDGETTKTPEKAEKMLPDSASTSSVQPQFGKIAEPADLDAISSVVNPSPTISNIASGKTVDIEDKDRSAGVGKEEDKVETWGQKVEKKERPAIKGRLKLRDIDRLFESGMKKE